MSKLGKHRRRALRLAVYIELMGGVPTTYSGQPFSNYANELEQQYVALRQELGADLSGAARSTGRHLIRKNGFAAIKARLESTGSLMQPNQEADGRGNSWVAHSYPTTPILSEREGIRRKAASKCRRKRKHPDYLSALHHASLLGDEGLNIYPCDVCHGLHVGHRQNSEARRRRLAVKELRSLDLRIQEVDQKRGELLAHRRKILAGLLELEVGRADSPRSI